jgi:hypothetical protein
VVITSPHDDVTRSVCKEYCIRHVVSEEFKRDGPFNKARMIQKGFDQIGAQEWVLHVDADVVLPHKFRELLEWAHLDETCIYGADRCHVLGWDNWQKIKADGGWCNFRYDSVNKFLWNANVGNRHVPHLHGYCPIGFFQLFHGSEMIDRGFHLKRYNLFHGEAARTDVQFALQWDRRKRLLLPEVIVLHLDSEQTAQGANWKGRTTKYFGPPPGKHHPKWPNWPTHNPHPGRPYL